MGIRGLLSVLVPGLFALGFLGAAVVGARAERDREIESMRVREARVLEVVGLAAAVYLAENDVAGLDNLVAEATHAGRQEDLLDLAVVDEEGRIVAHSNPTRFNTVLADDFTRDAVARDGPTARVEGSIMRVSVPARSGIRWGTVIGRYSLDRPEARVQAQRREIAAVGFLLAGLAGLVLSGALTRLVVRPLAELGDAARRMGDGDLSARVHVVGVAELVALGDTFNRMAETLAAARGNLERTVAERTDELQKANARLEHLALTDGLTGLHNHRHFQEALAREVARADRTGRPLGVLMIDVDHFKRLNDALGHPAGDEVLRVVARAIAASVRRGDLCARYGGEEFAVLLPETDAVEAALIAERSRKAVGAAFAAASPDAHVTVSIGVAVWPRDGRTPEAVLGAADRALYVAKRTGRDRVVEAQATWA